MIHTRVVTATFAIGFASAAALANPAGIDGQIGADWSGAGVTHRVVDSSLTGYASYDTYFRSDGTYVYFGLDAHTTPQGGSFAGQFANIYISTTTGGSNIGMEVTNDRFFTPVSSPNPLLSNNPTPDGYYYSQYVSGGLASQYQWSWASNPVDHVIEVAIPVAFFTDDPLNMGFAPATNTIRWRTSQSFGYDFVIGNSFGPDYYGTTTVPAPGAAAALGLAGLVGLRRRR
ncbi:MAG: hypothetical protein GC200_07625 [Tepidisphaera sp.]|nr:hypothetical protein [Tepidisphaera sp.]